jgi:hypothetical protein
MIILKELRTNKENALPFRLYEEPVPVFTKQSELHLYHKICENYEKTYYRYT